MVYIFKTSVTTKKAVKELEPILDNILPESTWNFDLHDCDNILRVESSRNVVDYLTEVLNAFGISCQELV